MMKKETLLNLDLKLRPVTWGDLQSVTDLIYAVCEDDGDVTVATSLEELEKQWRSDEFNPETDAFAVEAPDGRVVGYSELYNYKEHADLGIDAYFHPDFKHIGGMLLERTLERARAEIPLAAPDVRVFVRSTTDGKDTSGRAFHTQLGFSPVRYHWRMEITLKEAPSAVAFPSGVELRPFDREAHARLVWQAENDSFSEHWGMHPRAFELWSSRKLEISDFDPTLWLVAWDGDEIAGFSQNRFRMGIGWVNTLGVRKAWRKNGLGLALLQHSFGEFYRRGMPTIGLGVDASNATGAPRLYQRAGMTVASEFVTFEKELRPGRELEDASERM